MNSSHDMIKQSFGVSFCIVLKNYVNLRRHVVQPWQMTLTEICITYTAFVYQAQYWYRKNVTQIT